MFLLRIYMSLEMKCFHTNAIDAVVISRQCNSFCPIDSIAHIVVKRTFLMKLFQAMTKDILYKIHKLQLFYHLVKSISTFVHCNQFTRLMVFIHLENFTFIELIVYKFFRV